MPSIDSNDPLFRAYLDSKEFKEADPTQKRDMLLNFKEATPKERHGFVYGTDEYPGLTLPPQYLDKSKFAGTRFSTEAPTPVPSTVAAFAGNLENLEDAQSGKGTAAMTTSTILPMAAAALAARYAGPFAGPAALAAEYGGNLLARKLNVATGTEEPGKLGDALSVLGMPLARTFGSLFRAGTGPGKRAIQTADEANLVNQQGYQADQELIRRANQGEITPGEFTPKDVSPEAGRLVDTKVKGDTTFDRAVDKRLYTRQNQAQKAIDTAAEREEALPLHAQAAEELPTLADKTLTGPSVKARYTGAKADAQGLSLDPSGLRDTAEELGVQLRLPAEGTQSKFPRLTDALQEFGANPDNPGVPLERATATVQKLGQLVGKLSRSGGEEYGAAKQLYGALLDDLNKAAASDPATGKAVGAFLEAQAAARKSYAVQDYRNIFQIEKGVKLDEAGNPIINKVAAQNAYAKLRNEDRFYAGSFSDKEHQAIEKNFQDQLARLPDVPSAGAPVVPRDPSQPVGPGNTRVELPTNPNLNPDAPTFPQPKGPIDPASIAEPEFARPTVEGYTGKELISRARQAGSAGFLAGVTGFSGGLSPMQSVIAAGGTALVALGIPPQLSKLILSRPGGEAFLRAAMAGEFKVTPHALGAFLGGTRQLQPTTKNDKEPNQ